MARGLLTWVVLVKRKSIRPSGMANGQRPQAGTTGTLPGAPFFFVGTSAALVSLEKLPDMHGHVHDEGGFINVWQPCRCGHIRISKKSGTANFSCGRNDAMPVFFQIHLYDCTSYVLKSYFARSRSRSRSRSGSLALSVSLSLSLSLSLALCAR